MEHKNKIQKLEHTLTGNCWIPSYACYVCGANLCDVCHLHDQPRGECDKCSECLMCVDASLDLKELFG